MRHKIIAVDLQNDFATEGGKYYTKKRSVEYLNQEIFPYLKEKNIKIAEIISDYRPPRPGDRGDCCHPGTWGYESIISKDLVDYHWVKCMNSPIWVRQNIGEINKTAGLPYQDTNKFGEWLHAYVGSPKEVTPVLIGLTIDCCVLSTAQELSWRGYYPIVIREAVDHYTGEEVLKEQVLKTPIPNWASVTNWNKIKDNL